MTAPMRKYKIGKLPDGSLLILSPGWSFRHYPNSPAYLFTVEAATSKEALAKAAERLKESVLLQNQNA